MRSLSVIAPLILTVTLVAAAAGTDITARDAGLQTVTFYVA